MKNTFFFLVCLVLVLLLAGCKANPAYVYCPTIAEPDVICRPDDGSGAKDNEEKLDAVSLPQYSVGIYTDPFGAGEKPVILTGLGYQAYPGKYTITIPTSLVLFKTEPYACQDGTNTCMGTIDNINVTYTIQGVTQTRIIGVDITASLTFNVNAENVNEWIQIVGSETDASSTWFAAFWNDFRLTSRTLDLGEFDLPADNGGEASRRRIAQAMMDKFATGDNAWKYTSTFTLKTFVIRQLYLNNETAIAGYSQGSTTSVDAQATKAAESIFNAQTYATQQAIICQNADPIGCALLMQAYQGGQNPVIVQPQYGSTPTP
ncbi:hypothetical protein KKB64_04165 [Patescibacteria group bacterium]|nr:hypothetical protein [Patescibacteria group bacterium]MBU1472950.1 hypothetical protein [Patescibacteria group bacterium]